MVADTPYSVPLQTIRWDNWGRAGVRKNKINESVFCWGAGSAVVPCPLPAAKCLISRTKGICPGRRFTGFAPPLLLVRRLQSSAPREGALPQLRFGCSAKPKCFVLNFHLPWSYFSDWLEENALLKKDTKTDTSNIKNAVNKHTPAPKPLKTIKKLHQTPYHREQCIFISPLAILE